MHSKIEVRDTASERGRGVFARERIRCGDIIERAPVIVLPKDESLHLRKTQLYNYFFQWGTDGATAIVLGFGSMYNHATSPNVKHVREFENLIVRFVAVRDIDEGEEIFINYLGDYAGRARDKSLWFERSA